MKKVLCDRCGEDCENTYYKIAIYGYPTEDEDGRTTFEAASQNLFTFMSNKHFCNSCKQEIEKLMNETSI